MLWMSGVLQISQGERTRAEELWNQLEELAERTHVATISVLLAQRDVTLATLDGRLEDALALARQFVDRAEDAGAPVRGRRHGFQLQVAPALYLGRAEALLTASEDFARLPAPGLLGLISTVVRGICLAHLGHDEDARSLLGPLLDRLKEDRDPDEAPTAALVVLLQAAVVLGHRAAARVLSARLD
jgi:hypothetical protein